MTINFKYILFLLLSAILFQCVPPEEVVLTEVTRDLRDSTLQEIIRYQDEQKTAELYPFFRDKDPSYRYAAAMAFGSTKDKMALDSLALLLKDVVPEVRVAAAYAIGQLREERGANILMGAFEQYDTARQFVKSNGIILEAVGKCAPKETLNLLTGISTYKATDTLLLKGQAYGIYRFAMRKMVSPEGTSKMLAFVNNPLYPKSVRLIAANYLGRAAGIDISANVQSLSETFATESDAKIRSPLALALGKIKTPAATNALIKQFNQETDYRIKVNTIRALNGADYDSVSATILTALDDPNLKIAQMAAQFLINNGTARQAASYYRMSKVDRPWQVQLALLEAANKNLPPYMVDTKGGINATFRKRFLGAQTTTEKAAVLNAMGDFGWNYSFMLDQIPNLQTPIEKSSLVSGIGRIIANPDFDKVFGVSRRRVTRDLSGFLLDVFRSGDVGSMAVAADILNGINDNFKTALQDSLPIIIAAQKDLDLPAATETYDKVQNAIDFFQGKTPAAKQTAPAFNHPIDFNLLQRVTSSAAAVIQTAKGKIRVSLFPLLAPGTVTNFIQLAESEFFKDKSFHRVVPNFVIQGGCPRGDGYGSLPYSIRSELPLAYYDEAGYIGMASAGNHTEGTQFFITHSPTPHLDGGYTIFGKVTEGMEAVHQMEAGDNILSVAIRY
ncbi:MAG: peptidylprolyl isomerase [Saprospiraceae bacterium]